MKDASLSEEIKFIRFCVHYFFKSMGSSQLRSTSSDLRDEKARFELAQMGLLLMSEKLGKGSADSEVVQPM